MDYKTPIQHAFFSSKAAEQCGTVTWLGKDGSEVIATGVDEDIVAPGYNWPDKVYLGVVTRFLHRNGWGKMVPQQGGITSFHIHPDDTRHPRHRPLGPPVSTYLQVRTH